MALIDLPSAIVGVVVGAIVVAVLLEMRMRAAESGRQAKLTSAWRLSEMGRPIIMARDLVDVEVPRGSRVVASGLVEADVFAGADVRQVPMVRAEAAVDAEGTKAILFLAGIRPGAWALVTTDRETVSRLASEARSLWDRADPYVERGTIGQLAGRHGVNVETWGTVQDVLPYQDGHLLRLAHQGELIGVLVERDPTSLVGQDIQVRGRLDRDRSGYPVIEATDVRRLQ